MGSRKISKCAAVMAMAASLGMGAESVAPLNGKSIQKSAPAESLRLENTHIDVRIDQDTGAIRSIRDKDQDIEYPFSGIGFDVETETVAVRSDKATDVKAGKDGVELCFSAGGLDIKLHYRLGAADHFVEKWLTVKAADGKPYFLNSVVLEDVTSAAFNEIHFHDDNTIWHCPINLFLRGEKGGCFAGLEYPYWKLEQKGKEGFRLGYEPNVQAAAGEVNTSEKYFVGVYRKEGIYRYSQGPYPGKRPNPFLSFKGTGLDQHFKDGKVPSQAVSPEVLDWGEVWAMQAFMRRIQPDDLQLPEDGYWIWQNGWWAGLFDPKTKILDTLKAAGIHDIMTAHTWYGRGNHPNLEAYLYKMRIDPLGFPKDAAVAGLAGKNPGAGWHTPQEIKLDVFKPGEFTSAFIAPPAMETFIDYGKKVGVHVNSFSVPGLLFEAMPEWRSLDAKGNPSQYLFGRAVSCPASDDYMKHALALHEAVFSKYQPRWWGWDGRWLSHWEVEKYRPGPEGTGLDPCYAKNHGHLPGDNFYKEWKNIMSFLETIRKRHPRLCLESYYGLKRGEVWALRNLNAADNYYETSGDKMNRFQAWHNQNDRFRPVYKNYSALFGGNSAAFRNNVLSSISHSSYCQLGPGFKDLALEENRAFLKKWRAWASANLAYLKVKRDLFGCPGFHRIDGSAHIIGDRGFLFLFPAGTGLTARAIIPINRWIGLEEKPDALYRVTEVFPQEGRVIGTYRTGDDFAFDMPADSPVVLSLEPAPAGAQPKQNIPLADASQVEIVKAFNDEVSPGDPNAKPKEFLAEEHAFDGSAQTAIVLGDLGLKAPATLSFSINPSDTAPDRRILSQTSGAANQAGALRLAVGHLQIWDGNAWQALLSSPIPTGEWTDITLVFAAEDTVTALRNGKAESTVASRMDFNGVPATLGGKFLGRWGEPFLGSIKSVRIENRAIPFESAPLPKTVDWKSMMTIAKVQRDAGGKLLPLQSYDETIKRGMSFMLDDHLKWFKGPPESLVDENGKTQMPWVYFSNLQHNGAPFPNSVDKFVSYPAFHHALMIRTFLRYRRYAGDKRALAEAVKLADWEIAHSTPAEWAYGSFPYSTYEEKKPGGFRDRTGLMPDKAAIMALAYLQLHEATGEARFLRAADAIGQTLSKRQRPNGTWPFRVDPKTEKVVEEYTSSVIYALMLFEKLDKLNGNDGYRAYRDKTWNWLVNGPIKTKEFRGFYEDIPVSTKGRTNYDCLDTIRYLLANRTADNGYLEMAKDLNAWIEKTFMDTIRGFEPAEGIREQLQCNVVMGIHSLNWASMLLDLAEATGDEKMRRRAMQTANYVTYYLQPDNRIVVGFQYSQWWYSCHVGVILYLFDFIDAHK